MGYMDAMNNTDAFVWNTQGSKSGKSLTIDAARRPIPGDSWMHLSIDNWDETIRIRASKEHITRSGKLASETVLIDMDHNSARQLLAWLKNIYEA